MGYPRFRSNERLSFRVRADPPPPAARSASVQLIMPIDRVGIGPARPCMLMCERTSVSPLRVSVSSIYTAARVFTHTRARAYHLHSVSSIHFTRRTRVRVHMCVTRARCTYARMISKEAQRYLSRCVAAIVKTLSACFTAADIVQ